MNLPPDFRQHNLTEYNSNIFNPAFALSRNDPHAMAIWGRWQWQTIDPQPTTWFANYTHKLNANTAIGGGFFQHNTGLFFNTGGLLTYAGQMEFSENVSLAFGLNVFGFNQQLADDRFVQNPLPGFEDTDDFILQMAPGLVISVGDLHIGATSQNLLDYNVTTNERSAAEERVITGHVSYDIPVDLFNGTYPSRVQPTVYVKSVPDNDLQLGISTLLTTGTFWVQGGYNNFYGISGGLGGRFFKNLSIGGLVEFGIDSSLDGMDPTFEIVTSYNFDSIGKAKEEKEEEEQEDAIVEENSEESGTKEKRKSRRERKLEEEQRKEELLAQERKQVMDSIENARKREAAALVQRAAEKRKRDSVVNAQRIADEEVAKRKAELERVAQQQKVEVTPQAGEKYEEVVGEDNLQPGFYLIANVFGTKKYFEAFMRDLKGRGLAPKSFLRSKNKYNYVY
ncbi:MAG: PorP/SprF family type IX secretion system membrane protein, partial [Flavobacteriaceae bacterium]